MVNAIYNSFKRNIINESINLVYIGELFTINVLAQGAIL